MSEKISVLIKEPGRKPRHVHISNRLENFQKTVGGYIETVTIGSDSVIICDEEGRLKGKPHCCKLFGIDFVGTVILAGVRGEKFCDFPLSYERTKQAFSNLWEV